MTRWVVTLFSLAVLAAPATAQTSARPARVGYLNFGAAAGTPENPSVPRIIPAFRDGVRDLGHEVGRTLLIEFATPNSSPSGFLPSRRSLFDFRSMSSSCPDPGRSTPRGRRHRRFRLSW
jgi:hypothetical protein